jgi:hypothetical protein
VFALAEENELEDVSPIFLCECAPVHAIQGICLLKRGKTLV